MEIRIFNDIICIYISDVSFGFYDMFDVSVNSLLWIKKYSQKFLPSFMKQMAHLSYLEINPPYHRADSLSS